MICTKINDFSGGNFIREDITQRRKGAKNAKEERKGKRGEGKRELGAGGREQGAGSRVQGTEYIFKNISLKMQSKCKFSP